MNNIIFLDFDGVFILNGEINKNCILNLNKITTITNYKYVISSDWKTYNTIEELKMFFGIWGIEGVILDKTLTISSDLGLDLETIRKNEIEKYINSNNITKYIIIDDLKIYDNNDNFFHTDYNFGLTNKITNKILTKITQ